MSKAHIGASTMYELTYFALRGTRILFLSTFFGIMFDIISLGPVIRCSY
jgi:hypothetical protein